MGRVYVLIDTESGKASAIAEALRKRPGVALVDTVAGPHDVIAVLEEMRSGEIASTTVNEIRALTGVKYVTVCTGIRGIQS
ncbi:MAG: Lrp/AsnC family transcriptional regulator [Dehalococcoidia bacterium]|nr:Lrp/AsnC family transcriptional regulator [Dehalococcoidia bacterium]